MGYILVPSGLDGQGPSRTPVLLPRVGEVQCGPRVSCQYRLSVVTFVVTLLAPISVWLHYTVPGKGKVGAKHPSCRGARISAS
jgi:hypothetical protein